MPERPDPPTPPKVAYAGALSKLRAAAKRPEPAPVAPVSKSEPPFDPTTWGGALITMAVFDAVLWVVQFVNAADNYRLDRFGLRPREIGGLEGIITAPFLHTSFGHLLTNSRAVRPARLGGAAVGRAAVPAVDGDHRRRRRVGDVAGRARPAVIVGVSGLVMGLDGLSAGPRLLLPQADVDHRRRRWSGSSSRRCSAACCRARPMCRGRGTSAGSLAGVLAAWLMHPRRPRRPPTATRGGAPAVSGPVSCSPCQQPTRRSACSTPESAA